METLKTVIKIFSQKKKEKEKPEIWKIWKKLGKILEKFWAIYDLMFKSKNQLIKRNDIPNNYCKTLATFFFNLKIWYNILYNCHNFKKFI